MRARAPEPVIPRARGLRLASPAAELLDGSPDELVSAYCEVHSDADKSALLGIIRQGARDFRLSGVDLMPVRGGDGRIAFKTLEVNSAPGFAYCTPGADAWERAYRPCVGALLEAVPPTQWAGVALLTESKIPIETEGFSACLREATGQRAWVLGPGDLLHAERQRAPDGGTLVSVGGRRLHGGLRYLHTRPWHLLPPDAVGGFINGTSIDLRGARNKVAAQQAFEAFNRFWRKARLAVDTPRSWTVGDAEELAAAVAQLDGWAVSKIADGNSGVGVEFFHSDHVAKHLWPPFPFVIQEMLLPPALAPEGEAALAGACVRHEVYAYDLRVVILSTMGGYRPLMVYGRRARVPLAACYNFQHAATILDGILKVNIAVPTASGFELQTDRLMLADEAGWRAMGLDLSEMRRAVVSSILATAAVDRFGMPLADTGETQRRAAPDRLR